MIQFKDRIDAGKRLADHLKQYHDNPDVMVIGLPRGGVVVAFEIAQALHVPLDIVVPRKLGAPGSPELAVGAITEDGSVILNDALVADMGLTKQELDPIVQAEKKEAQRRLKTYRANRPSLDLTNKIVILVDDGIATGATMRAAIKSVRAKGAKKIIIAVPVAPKLELRLIKHEADSVVCLETAEYMLGINDYYHYFPQVDDVTVIDLMQKSTSF